MTTPATVRASRYNVSAPGANTNILADNITPHYRQRLRTDVVGKPASYFVLTMIPEDATIVDLFTTDGTTTFRSMLNEGNPFPADVMTSLKIPVNPALDYNFSVQTNVAIRSIEVREQMQGDA